MRIQAEHTYSENDVYGILRESEGRRIGSNPNPGHAMSLHELMKPVTGGTSIYLRELRGRFIEEEDGSHSIPNTSGAFQNCLVPAVTFALNSGAGRNALRLYASASVHKAVIRADITTGCFRMVYYKRDEGILAPDGKAFLPHPGTPLNFWRPSVATAGGIFILLYKAPNNEMHVQTAYPMLNPPPQSTTFVAQGGNGSQNQNLPI